MLIALFAAHAASPHSHSALSPAELIAAAKAHLENGARCLTPLVAEIKARADELSPEDRRWATETFTPKKKDILDRPAAPPPPSGTAPCNSAASLGIGDGDNSATSEHFIVQWDGDTITESTAQGFLDSLEEGWQVQVEELGWREPLQSDDYLMLAFVAEGNYQSAYTTIDYCGASYAPYIVTYEGSFSNRSWGETMAVHEFNHSLQFSYGSGWEFWWWEATATYIESQVYPSSNWWAYYVSGYSDNPQLAFNASDQNDQDIFWHMYGMAIWGAYLDEYVGGAELVRETWEAARGERDYYTYSMRDAMDELDYDFDTLFEDFIVKNTVMAYDAQRVLPAPDELGDIDELPTTEEVDGTKRPEGYGQTYTRIEQGSGEGTLIIDFVGDEDVNWAVHLVEVTRDEILRDVKVEVVDGVGTASLEAFGDEDVILVVSPMEEGDDKYGYEYTLSVEEPVVDEPDDTGSVDETPKQNANREGEQAACGCDSGGSATLGISLALGVLALARRRR